MSELMDLVDRVSKAEAENITMKEDMVRLQRTVERQMKALAGQNPAQLESLKRAREEAATMFATIMPQVTPGSDIHRSIVVWMETHGMHRQGNIS